MSNGLLRSKMNGTGGRMDALSAEIESIREELKQLNQDIANTLVQVAQAVNGLSKEFEAKKNEDKIYVDVLNAVVGLIGPTKVAEEVKKERDAQALAKVEQAKVAVTEGLTNGKLLASQTVVENSLLVLREFPKDSETPNHPGATYLAFSGLSEEYQKALLGKPLGAKIPSTVGGLIEVLEVYTNAPTATPESKELEAKVEEALLAELNEVKAAE